MNNSFKAYSADVQGLLDAVEESEVGEMVEALCQAYRDGRLVFIIGNGGSGASASHLCEDLGKGTLTQFIGQRRLKVISLTDNSAYILAWANDTSFDRVFEEQLRNLASAGDLLIAISGSGNSPNVIKAVEYANEIGMRTFGVTGFDGGKLLGLAQHSLYVKSHDMGMVEAVHGVVFHYVTDVLKARFAE